jgi:hypothetical protein
MANNRMYLVDTRTGDAIYFAKGFGDWTLMPDEKLLAAFLSDHDYEGAQGSESSSLILKCEGEDGCPPHSQKMWTIPPEKVAMSRPKVVKILIDEEVVETLWDYDDNEGPVTCGLVRLLSKQIEENRRLSKQVDDLQERGTKMTMARQRVSALIKRWEEAGPGFRLLVDELREANADS